MNIEASANGYQEALLRQVSTAVLAMSIRDARATGEQFQQLMEKADDTVQVAREAAGGHTVDIFA
jgi:hypothetical protein